MSVLSPGRASPRSATMSSAWTTTSLKSTVPVKTGEKVADTIRRYNKKAAFDVISNPEFLREGCAVPDLMNPDRIVIGSSSQQATDLMKKVYEPFKAPILVTDVNSAELIQHAANSFLSL